MSITTQSEVERLTDLLAIRRPAATAGVGESAYFSLAAVILAEPSNALPAREDNVIPFRRGQNPLAA